MTRKTIAIAILMGGALGAFLITRLATPSERDLKTLSITQGQGGELAFAFGNAELSGSLLDTISGDSNFTESVVQKYGEEILRINPRGSSASAVALPPEGTLESLIVEAVERPFVFSSFTERDIRTSSGKTREALVFYLNTIVAIQEERLSEHASSLLGAVARFVSENNGRELELAQNAMRLYIGDLLKISAPAPLASFHLGLLNLWQKRVALTNTILESADDPLKIVAAVEHLSQTAEEETRLTELLVLNISKLHF